METPTTNFSSRDQEAFARLSGDWNPMHMDAVLARRLQPGAPVAHGVHGFLWAMEQLARDGLDLSRVNRVTTRFSKFIYVDAPFSLIITQRSDTRLKAELVAEGLSVSTVLLSFGPRSGSPEDDTVFKQPDIVLDSARPLRPSLEAMGTMTGWLRPPVGEHEVRKRFPRLSASLGADRVAAIGQFSTLVGMVCPGLNSIFAGFNLEFVHGQPDRTGLGFRVSKADARRMVTMRVAGSQLIGEIVTFVRHEPVDTPTMADLAKLVVPNEFCTWHSLVVGGSRGLGAVAAKLIAAGGGRIVVTYARGMDDANSLVAEMNNFGGEGKHAATRLDAMEDIKAQLAELPAAITHLGYFATPQIYRPRAATYTPAVLEEFKRVYIDAFHEICQFLLASSGKQNLSVLYPSSVYVEERPKGMCEYAMAKSAGELLCAELMRIHANLHIVCPRLPRTQTDQTATLGASHNADPVAVILPILRELNAKAR